MRTTARFPALAASFAAPAALALAAFLAGCALPPYNEQLSLAQLTRSKLGEPVNKIGPIYATLEEGITQNRFYFLPDRDDPVDSGGFLVGTASYGLRVWYLADYSAGLESSWAIELENFNDKTNNYLLQPVESGVVDTNFFLTLTRYAQNDLRLIHSTGPSFVVQYTTELPLGSFLPVAVSVLGSNIYADNTSGSDPLFLLGSLGAGAYYEFYCQTNASTGLSYNAVSLETGLGLAPDDLTNAFYAHDPDRNRSYLSYPSGSSYVSYAWTWDEMATGVAASGFEQLTGVKGRIETVLSNGQLLAFAENSCTVHDSAGRQLYEFPLGALKFCYERFDSDGLFKLYFSLAYWLYGADDKPDKLYVEVYAIPTADLKDLD